MNRTMFLGLATLLFAGCQAAGQTDAPAGPFQFGLTRASTLDAGASTADGPLEGVIVSVRVAPESPTIPGELLWMGATDQTGHIHALFRTDRAGSAPLDVVFHKPGYRGPYTDETLRAAFGAFAPSARLAVPIDGLSSLTVILEKSS
jgi:hypothetical protein